MHEHQCHRTFPTRSASRTRGSPVASTTAATPFASALRAEAAQLTTSGTVLPILTLPMLLLLFQCRLKSAFSSRPS